MLEAPTDNLQSAHFGDAPKKKKRPKALSTYGISD